MTLINNVTPQCFLLALATWGFVKVYGIYEFSPFSHKIDFEAFFYLPFAYIFFYVYEAGKKGLLNFFLTFLRHFSFCD